MAGIARNIINLIFDGKMSLILSRKKCRYSNTDGEVVRFMMGNEFYECSSYFLLMYIETTSTAGISNFTSSLSANYKIVPISPNIFEFQYNQSLTTMIRFLFIFVLFSEMLKLLEFKL